MSQAIQTINNWTAKELIHFVRNNDIFKEKNVRVIVEKLTEVAEFEEKDFDYNEREVKLNA